MIIQNTVCRSQPVPFLVPPAGSGSRGCNTPLSTKQQNPGGLAAPQALLRATPRHELPKHRGLLLIWMREEYCGLSISSPVLIMQNIGQPQSLQAIIIRSP